METATLRIRMETSSNRNPDRRSNRLGLRRLIVCAVIVGGSLAILSQLRADIPWPEVVQRLAYENEKMARLPQGHNRDYFVVCPLSYTPMQSGFPFVRGFHAPPFTHLASHAR